MAMHWLLACGVVQDAGGQLPTVADITAAGGAARTSGSNTNYAFNASVPAQRAGFFSILQDVSAGTNCVVLDPLPTLQG